MTRLADRLLDRYYADSVHPYRAFEQAAAGLIERPDQVVLDAGCGRTVPVLRKFIGRAGRLIGIDLVDFTDVPPGIEAYNADLSKLPLPDASVDLIISRSVFEHLQEPEKVYGEFNRVLRPGGCILFLTANLWDYGTLIARMVPNRFHAKVVRFAEGRAEEDTFPTAYKTNTPSAVRRLSDVSGLQVADFQYLSQYPNYLMFNGFLFFVGMCFEKVISKVGFLRFLRGWILVTLQKPVR